MNKIAIIGSGAAGLAAAYYLHEQNDVFLFEAEARFGGHAYTYLVDQPEDEGLPLDLGFMVMNSKNYVHFQNMLQQLGLENYGKSDMSFGYYHLQNNFSYALNWDPQNYFSKKYNIFAMSHLKQKPEILPYLGKIYRTCNQITQDLELNQLEHLTLGDYFSLKNFPKEVIDLYLIPMGAAIWSTPFQNMLDFPAQSFFQFFLNHGLLDFSQTIQWQYIPGGSQTYVQAITQKLQNKFLQTPIQSILRNNKEITLVMAEGNKQSFDKVIIATHADEALKLLAQPTDLEQELLSSWIYCKNTAVLHYDEQVMPPELLSWASWNAVVEDENKQQTSLTYHLNRLQGHTEATHQYFLSLNRQLPIDEKKILLQVEFTHPTYSMKSFAAQKKLQAINGEHHTYFCGNYLGYGFHEDAALAGIQVARLLQGKKHV